MVDRVGAAIRRASQAARNAMRVLDGQAEAELRRIYTEAAEQVRAAVAAAADGGSRVRLTELRALLARIERVLEAVAERRTRVLDGAIEQAAELGVRPYTGPGLAAAGGSVPAPLLAGDALRLADLAVQFVRAFRAADGLVLSDRLWRIDRGARDAVTGVVEQAVVQGWSADKAAQEFVLRGQAVPAATEQAQNAALAPQVMRGADWLAKAPGGALDATLRVMRTEVNRAHGEAYMAGAEEAPGRVGFRFLLSPRHPRPDICDLLAAQNLHGLGPGVYPDRKSTPWPAHPNTLSFVVAVFADEVTPEHRAAKETATEALARLAPEIRQGVLGPTKAGYFDQGLLAKGLLRSPVASVQARLARQGRLPGR